MEIEIEGKFVDQEGGITTITVDLEYILEVLKEKGIVI